MVPPSRWGWPKIAAVPGRPPTCPTIFAAPTRDRGRLPRPGAISDRRRRPRGDAGSSSRAGSKRDDLPECAPRQDLDAPLRRKHRWARPVAGNGRSKWTRPWWAGCPHRWRRELNGSSAIRERTGPMMPSEPLPRPSPRGDERFARRPVPAGRSIFVGRSLSMGFSLRLHRLVTRPSLLVWLAKPLPAVIICPAAAPGFERALLLWVSPGRMGRFDGREALVTGAGSGLRRSTALLAKKARAVAFFDIAVDDRPRRPQARSPSTVGSRARTRSTCRIRRRYTTQSRARGAILGIRVSSSTARASAASPIRTSSRSRTGSASSA